MKYWKIILISGLLFSQSEQFNSTKAYNYVIKQCEFGPRFPGSAGHKACKQFLFHKMSQYCDEALIDKHKISDPIVLDSLNIYNIFGRMNPDRDKRILLMAHWDTRRFADKDLDSLNRGKPVMGANDGASGIAVLLTLMENLSNNKLRNIGIDFLFADAEDMGVYGKAETWAIGSKLFSKTYPEPLPQYAICVDMVGDKQLEIKLEGYSYQMTPYLMKYIWSLAEDMGYDNFKWEAGPYIIDDHVSFSSVTGIPSIDLIDLDYPHWHTVNDTPENVSQYSLGVIGNVLTQFLYNMDNMDKNE